MNEIDSNSHCPGFEGSSNARNEDQAWPPAAARGRQRKATVPMGYTQEYREAIALCLEAQEHGPRLGSCRLSGWEVDARLKAWLLAELILWGLELLALG